jgi:amidohydrolase
MISKAVLGIYMQMLWNVFWGDRMLTNAELNNLIMLRRALHQSPEISGYEVETAKTIQTYLEVCKPNDVLTNIGGNGLAFVFDGDADGPTVMVRAELDALPIQEITDVSYKSSTDNTGHLCGHDGHMAMLCGLGHLLARNRPARGRVVLLFQPAEETGQGARAVLEYPQFSKIKPDYVFALHNLPGMALGHVGLTKGGANCASRGLQIDLHGVTAHASMPETGVSPMQAVAELMPALTALGAGGPLDTNFKLVTVTHANMGEATFGVTPGHARIHATLRTLHDDAMQGLCDLAKALVDRVSDIHGLTATLAYHDIFHACENDPDAIDILHRACIANDVTVDTDIGPMRWSEDFGLFAHHAQSAMFLLGSGVNQPQLHNPNYDFPDDLISIGVGIFNNAVREILD